MKVESENKARQLCLQRKAGDKDIPPTNNSLQ